MLIETRLVSGDIEAVIGLTVKEAFPKGESTVNSNCPVPFVKEKRSLIIKGQLEFALIEKLPARLELEL